MLGSNQSIPLITPITSYLHGRIPPGSNIVNDVFDAAFLDDVNVDDLVMEGLEEEDVEEHPKVPAKELYSNEQSEKVAMLFSMSIGMIELSFL